MVKTFTLICFAIVVMVQWLVPGRMILKKSEVLKRGSLFRFKAAPVDPEDPFRGRYVTLNLNQEDRYAVGVKGRQNDTKKVYLQFTPDAAGYARISSLSQKKPSENNYLELDVNNLYHKDDSTFYHIEYPFSQYYMEESKAPAAESEYRRRLQDTSTRVYAAVRIWRGDAVIESVYINDSTLQQIVSGKK